MVSGNWCPLPAPSSVAGNPRRFCSRARSLANGESPDWFANSSLGLGSFRLQPCLFDGLGVSWKHRSSHGAFSRLRGIHVLKKPARALWIVLCPRLPDQNCAAAFFSGIRFLLVLAK